MVLENWNLKWRISRRIPNTPLTTWGSYLGWSTVCHFRVFIQSFLPLFPNEYRCIIFHMDTILIYKRMIVQEKLISRNGCAPWLVLKTEVRATLNQSHVFVSSLTASNTKRASLKWLPLENSLYAFGQSCRKEMVSSMYNNKCNSKRLIKMRGIEWSHPIWKCSQNLAFARIARKN